MLGRLYMESSSVVVSGLRERKNGKSLFTVSGGKDKTRAIYTRALQHSFFKKRGGWVALQRLVCLVVENEHKQAKMIASFVRVVQNFIPPCLAPMAYSCAFSSIALRVGTYAVGSPAVWQRQAVAAAGGGGAEAAALWQQDEGPYD